MIRLEVKEPPRARNPAANRSWDWRSYATWSGDV